MYSNAPAALENGLISFLGHAPRMPGRARFREPAAALNGSGLDSSFFHERASGRCVESGAPCLMGAFAVRPIYSDFGRKTHPGRGAGSLCPEITSAAREQIYLSVHGLPPRITDTKTAGEAARVSIG